MPRRMFRFAVFASSILLSVVYVDSQTCPNLAVALDPTFGECGKVLAQIDSANPVWVKDIVVQSDGKIVAMVETSQVGTSKLFRLNADGSIDSEFGNGGFVTFNWTLTLPSGARYGAQAQSLAIQKVGEDEVEEERVVVAGWAYRPSGRSALMGLRANRYLPDGTLDASFGTNGTVTLDGGFAQDLAVQPSDQKIVVLGGNTGLVRFNANGSLDSTFGTGGKVSVPQEFYGIAFDSIGRVLLSGKESVGKGKNLTWRMTVRRYGSDGTVDTSFGSSGMASASFGYLSSGTNIAVDAQDNVVVTGLARAVNAPSTSNFAVARFTSTGLPDPSFAGTGKAVFDFFGHDDFPTDVFIQASGKIIITGPVSPTAALVDFGAIRLNYNGTLDSSFGSNGRLVTDVYGADSTRASALQLDPFCGCEKLVMSGGDAPYTTFARFTTLPY